MWRYIASGWIIFHFFLKEIKYVSFPKRMKQNEWIFLDNFLNFNLFSMKKNDPIPTHFVGEDYTKWTMRIAYMQYIVDRSLQGRNSIELCTQTTSIHWQLNRVTIGLGLEMPIFLSMYPFIYHSTIFLHIYEILTNPKRYIDYF